MAWQVGEDEDLSKPATVDLADLFPAGAIGTIEELTLSGARSRKDVTRMTWPTGEPLTAAASRQHGSGPGMGVHQQDIDGASEGAADGSAGPQRVGQLQEEHVSSQYSGGSGSRGASFSRRWLKGHATDGTAAKKPKAVAGLSRDVLSCDRNCNHRSLEVTLNAMEIRTFQIRLSSFALQPQ